MKPSIVIISGPTASGKSSAALELAEKENGVVINADAMQCYQDLSIITARPTPEEESRVPHMLYGVLDAVEHGSAGWWVEHASAAVHEVWAQNKLPVLVGGTGMYLQSLMEGLSEIPPVSDAVKIKIRTSDASLYGQLQQRDPDMAGRLKPGDMQRITRALEVLEETGKSLLWWQKQGRKRPLPEAQFKIIRMEMPREELYARCDARFIQMMESGALEEVRALMEKTLPPQPTSGCGDRRESGQFKNLPIIKATGVPELSAHLRGEMSLDDAVAAAQQSTRNYAKRQLTWLRNQLADA